MNIATSPDHLIDDRGMSFLCLLNLFPKRPEDLLLGTLSGFDCVFVVGKRTEIHHFSFEGQSSDPFLLPLVPIDTSATACVGIGEIPLFYFGDLRSLFKAYALEDMRRAVLACALSAHSLLFVG